MKKSNRIDLRIQPGLKTLAESTAKKIGVSRNVLIENAIREYCEKVNQEKNEAMSQVKIKTNSLLEAQEVLQRIYNTHDVTFTKGMNGVDGSSLRAIIEDDFTVVLYSSYYNYFSLEKIAEEATA